MDPHPKRAHDRRKALGGQPAESRSCARTVARVAGADRRAADRGLDVGATEYIHERLVAERDNGRAVLLVSAELSEILALSDRVLVMFEGRILADLAQEQAEEESVGLLMAGRTREAT